MGLMGFRFLLAMLTTAAVADAYQPKGKGYSIPRVHPKGSHPVHPKGNFVAPDTPNVKEPLLPQLPLYLNPKGSFLHDHRRLRPVNPKGAILPSRPYFPRYNLRGSYLPARPKGQLEPHTSIGLHRPLNPKGSLAQPTQPLHPKGTLDMPKWKQTSSTQTKKSSSAEYKEETWTKKKDTNTVYPNYPSDPSANKPTVSPADKKKQTHPSNQHNPWVNSKTNPTKSNQQTNEPAGQVKDLNSQDQRQNPSVDPTNHGQQGNSIDTIGQNSNNQDQGLPPSQPGSWQHTNPSTNDHIPRDTWQVVDPSTQGQNPSDPWQTQGQPQNPSDPWQTQVQPQNPSDPWQTQNQPDTWQVVDPTTHGHNPSDPWQTQSQPDTWQGVDPSTHGQPQNPSDPWSPSGRQQTEIHNAIAG
ncbi:sporozoite surface protein 2-like [Haliotis rufescens]|uniref:sporozoite surface protein 2-like n=1 Tax=Haliotis rufescens TaxID=6454 RepID=UPI001EB08FA8|nr:sporozoite surface protein 2-like [Haliotis rufescens]